MGSGVYRGQEYTGGYRAQGYAAGYPAQVALPPLSGLKLWLKADAGVTQSGGTVSAWADQSGNGNDVTALTTGPAYTASAINGHPGLTFTDNSQILTRSNSPLSSGTGPRTAIVVAKTTDANGGTFFCIGKNGPWWGPCMIGLDGATPAIFLTSGAFNTFASAPLSAYKTIPIVVEIASPASGSPITYTVNGASIGVTGANAGADSADFFSIGNYYDSGPGAIRFLGVICEILLYDHLLSPTEEAQVSDYMKSKYGVA